MQSNRGILMKEEKSIFKECVMHLNQCPFCSSNRIQTISQVQFEKFNCSEQLMKCMDCHTFFWQESGQRVVYLSGFCETRWEDPDKCREHIKQHCGSEGIAYSYNVSFELVDEICGECPHKKFVIHDKSKRWSLC